MGAVLVTGGAGYVGSHVAKALHQAGRDVVVLDNLVAGHREAVRQVPLVVGDIADADLVQKIIRQYEVTAVMHFAGWLSVGESVKNPGLYYVNNVTKTIDLLNTIVVEAVQHLVFSSTCAVYGEPEEVPLTETHPTRPINAYGESKLAIEQALPHFERAHGLRSICLRYFNAAGADPTGELGEDHTPEEHLIPRALLAATQQSALVVFGDDYATPDGTCQRDYVHVTDLASAHIGALTALEVGKPSATYNLGNGLGVSVKDVISSVERVTGSSVPSTIGPRRVGDPAVLLASSARARSELKWQPLYSELDVIVETAWRWYQAHPHGYRTNVDS
tara:strand:+ start:8549 stop:9547 length:999 start_codon:yes stop_codon:yes gene_type:complete